MCSFALNEIKKELKRNILHTINFKFEFKSFQRKVDTEKSYFFGL